MTTYCKNCNADSYGARLCATCEARKEADALRGRAERAEAEVERLRNELDRMRPHAEGCNWQRRGDAYPCSCITAAARAEVERLREVLIEHERKLVEVWGKEENPYAVAYGWVKPMRDAALAGAPSETRREHDRALAERVREACIEALAESDGDPRSLPELDLDALLEEP